MRDCLSSYGGNIPLYSPDALWMLTRGQRVVADNQPDRRVHRPTVTTWAPSLAVQTQTCSFVYTEAHLAFQVTRRKAWLTHGHTHASSLFLFFLFCFRQKDTTQSQLVTKVAPDVFKVFVAFVLCFLFSVSTARPEPCKNPWKTKKQRKKNYFPFKTTVLFFSTSIACRVHDVISCFTKAALFMSDTLFISPPASFKLVFSWYKMKQLH